MRGALVVVTVAELVAGAHHLHAQVFVGADHVARAQTAHEQHDLLALQARLELVDHGLHQRLVLGDHGFGLGLDAVVEVAGDFAQALLDHGRAEEVVFHPWNAVLLFHVAADVVHRAVAVQHVELGLGRVLDLGDGAVAGPLGDHAQPHLFEQDAAGPGVATDVVVADDGHVVGGGDELGVLVGVGAVEHPVADRVVGQVVAERLAHAAETFAAHGHDGLAFVLLALLLRHGFDVVTDQADGALALDRDALVQREQLLNFINDLVELFVTAEHDVLFLEIAGELHRHEGVDAGGADVVVAARGPAVLAAAHRAVADVDHVLDGPPHHALGAGVGTTADGHDARQGLDVGLDAAVRLAFFERAQVLGPALGHLFRIGLQHFIDQGFVRGLAVFNCGSHGVTPMDIWFCLGDQGRPTGTGQAGRACEPTDGPFRRQPGRRRPQRPCRLPIRRSLA